MENIIAIKRKRYGHPLEYAQCDKSELKAYRADGWVLNEEPTPQPEPPDIEILELVLTDATRALEKARAEAQRIIAPAQAAEANARQRLQDARAAIVAHEQIERDEARDRDKRNAVNKVAAALRHAKDPTPARELMALAVNEAEAAFIRELFVNSEYVIGKDDSGDYLVVLNKQEWLTGAAEREAKAAAEREAIVRARMEAKA